MTVGMDSGGLSVIEGIVGRCVSYQVDMLMSVGLSLCLKSSCADLIVFERKVVSRFV